MQHSNSAPLVSIVMPHYNAEPYLVPAIEAIQQLPYSSWELLIADGGSGENDVLTLNRMAANDARIKVLHNPQRLIIPALRLAYAEASGTYITRMDADDLAQPGRLGWMVEALEKAGLGHVAVGHVEYFAEDTLGDGYQRYAAWLNDLTSNRKNFTERYRECTIPSICWMMHREDFEAIGAFNSERYPEDYDLAMRMFQHQMKIAPVNKVIHLWRDHQNRTTRNSELYLDNRFIAFKTDWFLQLDYDGDKPLVLWGAGKKGKSIAQCLSQEKIVFRWMCNNRAKIGHQIHGVEMEEENAIFPVPDATYIIAIAGPQDQNEILTQLQNNNITVGENAFFFC